MRAALALALLLGGCAELGERKVDAMIEAKLEAGEALITCRESSSGTCHVVFVTEATRITAQAKQGETGSASGLSPTTRYCVDAAAPNPDGCRLKPLREGQQIARYTKMAK